MPNSRLAEQHIHPPAKVYKLPTATNLDEVNENFDTLASHMASIATAMKEHAENTNNNFTQLSTETRDNLEKVGQDLKSILSSQTMMLVICIMFICFVIVIAKGIFDAVAPLAVDLLQ